MKTNATSFAKISIGWAALLAGGIFIVTDATASESITSVKGKRGLLIIQKAQHRKPIY